MGAAPVLVQGSSTIARSSGLKFLSKGAALLFKKTFLIIFFVVPLLYGIYLGVIGQSFFPFFDYIAPRLISPLQNVLTTSLQIQANQGSFIINENIFLTWWSFIKVYFVLMQAGYIMYKWNYVFYYFIFRPMDSSKVGSNILLTIGFYMLLTLVYLGATEGILGLAIPVHAIVEFVKATPYLLKETVMLST